MRALLVWSVCAACGTTPRLGGGTVIAQARQLVAAPAPTSPPAMRRPFFDDVQAYEPSMWLMLAAYLGLVDKRSYHYRWFTADVLAGLTPPDARRIVDDLAAVEATCKAQFPGRVAVFPAQLPAGNGRMVQGVRIVETAAADPDVWCYVAGERATLMAAALAHKPFISAVDLELVERGFGGYMTVEAARQLAAVNDLRRPAIEEEKRWYQAVGLPLPVTPIQRLSDQLTSLAREAASLPPSLLVQGSALHDARVERIAIATLAASDRGISLIGAAMDAGGFAVVNDDRDVPMQRWRVGRVVVRRGHAPWCEEHGFSYVEPRAGRGFRPSNTVQFRGVLQLVSCP